MWPRLACAGGRLLALLLLRLLLLPAEHVQSSALTVYGMLGGEVSFPPAGFNVTITSITWIEGQNIAIEWEGGELDFKRHYKERGRLDTTTGVMTITGLKMSDSEVYTPEINDKRGDPIHLMVITAVNVPRVSYTCDKDTTRCNLTCDADTTGAEPVTYMWKSDEYMLPSSLKSHVIEKEDTNPNITQFSCELKNPVSSASSQPIANPFTPPEGLNIPNGLIVCLSLLGAVLLLVVVHRLKAGVWFYEKESMPWEADFWKKYEIPPRIAAVSNGNFDVPQQRPSDEGTPLT